MCSRYLQLFLIISSCLVFLALTNESEDYEDDDYDLPLSNSTTSNATLVFTKTLQNVTRDPGRMIKFICEVQNLDVNNSNVKVTFTWKQNHVVLEKGEQRISIKTVKVKEKEHKYRSTLRITNLEIFDRGFYDCVASNGIDKIRAQALLEVSPDPSTWGRTAAKLDTLEEPESYYGSTTNSYLSTRGGLKSIPVNGNDEILLSKQTEKTFVDFDISPSGKVSSRVQEPDRKQDEPFCQIYTGSRCEGLLGNKYVFVQPPFTQSDIEEKLNNAFIVISQSNDISSNCEKYVYPSMCYSAFPVCSEPDEINTYQQDYVDKLNERPSNDSLKHMRNTLTRYLKRMCKDDCILLESELCSKEYAIAKRHPIIGQIPQLEECELIPDEISNDPRNCLALGVELQNVDKDDTCYWDHGRLYRGVKDVSISGKKCLRWSYQFHIGLSENPELTGHNYCRNPGNVESQPFCFVDQNEKETCGISKCAYIIGMYVFLAFVGVSVTIGLLVTFLCCRRKKKFARNLQNMSTPTADKNIYGNPSPTSPMEMNRLLPPNIPPQRSHHSSKGGVNTIPHYNHKEVHFIDELGEGAFGKVYKAELKLKTGGKIFVAVKSLKENASAKTQADFQREIELISDLKHPNIICLMGVVLKHDPICMLFEYMSEGDLHEFLIANSPPEGKNLSQNQFLHIAIQIAQGMEYLSENHYVHRDLAARNCLVTKDLVVKISDFGLSRDMYSCDYYRVQSKSLLPVRWMPPESILYGKFTTESDVWSYGVVLWEIYSYGLQPYYGYNNQEVINMIRSRKLLPCPEACPSYCYALMVECWAELAARRPTFVELAHRLRVWLQSGSSNGAYFRTPEHGISVGGVGVCPGNHVMGVSSLPHKYGHGSKSSQSHSSGSGYVDTVASEPIERSLKRASCNRLNESQNSLSSRCSSLGPRTHSTNLSTNDSSLNNKCKKAKKKSRDSSEPLAPYNLKNMVVNTNSKDGIEMHVTN